MGMLQEYVEAIDLAATQSILALGCGTGAEVREVLRRPDFRGRVTAIDISADLVERGKGLAVQEGFAGRTEWLVGDAQELRLSDRVFDLVLAHTLVSHVPDPKRVVRDAARVVRPGGTVVIFDGDYATMTFGVDREMDEKIISGVIANPRVMRGMPQLLREAGLKLVDSRGGCLQRSDGPTSFSDPCSHFRSSCRRRASPLRRRPKRLLADSCGQAKMARFSLDTISTQ